jgi:hypothetical protein
MSALTTRQDFYEPAHITQATATMLAALLGDDDGAAPISARGRRRLRIAQLLQADAPIDAALELIALQLPRWQLRRIAYDDGEWHCALSQTREMPDWLDDCAEARHPDLALAVLHAAVEARRLEQRPAASAAIRPARSDTTLLCCDNFF